MKHPAGYAPRRLAPPKKQVQLDLRRRPAPEPDDDLATGQKSPFWKWVGLVALLHLMLICLVGLIYEISPTPTPPPQQFMDLIPPGDIVHGTPGTQEAPKVGPTTPAPTTHHSKPPPAPVPPAPPTPVAVQPPPPAPTPPTPAPVEPPPIVQAQAPDLVPDKPILPKPAPVKPKVKVDLTLADGPTPTVTKPKPKPVHKKPKPIAVAPDDTSDVPDQDAPSSPDSAGLSKEQIAARLGDKMKAAGIENSVKIGPSGSDHSTANPFADFYASIHDQVMNKWTSPNLSDDTAVNPVVLIHVEKDGRVPPESVVLTQSSGNPTYDDSAVAAAKSLGYLLQPLPDGCPPDIHITFKLTR